MQEIDGEFYCDHEPIGVVVNSSQSARRDHTQHVTEVSTCAAEKCMRLAHERVRQLSGENGVLLTGNDLETYRQEPREDEDRRPRRENDRDLDAVLDGIKDLKLGQHLILELIGKIMTLVIVDDTELNNLTTELTTEEGAIAQAFADLEAKLATGGNLTAGDLGALKAAVDRAGTLIPVATPVPTPAPTPTPATTPTDVPPTGGATTPAPDATGTTSATATTTPGDGISTPPATA